MHMHLARRHYSNHPTSEQLVSPVSLRFHGYIMYNLFRYGSDESILIMVPTYCLALIVLFAASYKILSPLFLASGTRVTAAIIATSIAYIATTYAGQLLSTATYDAVTIVAPLLIGILAWGTFLVLARGKA